MGNFPETSATAAAKSRRFARSRCAFHLEPDSSRKHGAACHTAVVFPEVYMLRVHQVVVRSIRVRRTVGAGKETRLRRRQT